MKLDLKKSHLKKLSNQAAVAKNLTPNIIGGAKPSPDSGQYYCETYFCAQQ
ncbi:hypothetical protein ACFOEE_12530 [Pseudoalteromonas fenneropenaei]|uniref:Uncharacterized protein n=1 Tax=Pseudoalteromonas fenneropenaei TaxID=1737459 RepID=A0ABV7CLC3_9GAMM